MKLEVIAVFRDKYTNHIYKIGETLEADELRGADLIARGFAAAVDNQQPFVEKPKASTKKKAGGGNGRSNDARKG